MRSLAPIDEPWHAVVAGTALSLGALLLGLVADGLYDACIRHLVRSALPKDHVRGFLGWRSLLGRFESSLSRLRVGPTKSGLRSLALAASDAVRDAELQLSNGENDVRDLALMLGFVRGRRDRPLREVDTTRVRDELRGVATDDVREALSAWLVIRILDQRELLAHRLVADNADLFAEYDRLRSEAQFRMAVAPPLLAIAIVLALSWTPWVALSLLAIPVLIAQAIRKGNQASDLLIDAMLIRKIDAPAFEQLARATSELSRTEG